eukprot:CAMPEP_0195159360 /NCGR_PEP_ID=MMETSP0448-20130528/186126_1 /TAXON_ID=66468 /ORGANISM="Heterocapsa triquestra, Strain CCMP 448" /LENGTH=489 /DNA_ID=CAMNT_0040198159 /DNA_START=182 /DNA_END=1648 /DNA_ORIENTATION=-
MEGKRMLGDTDVVPLLVNRRVLIRADFDVPLDADKPNKILDIEQISAVIPTIQYLLDTGVSAVIICSHLSRPCGQSVAAYSLVPVAKCLAELTGMVVTFLTDCCGAEVEEACADVKPVGAYSLAPVAKCLAEVTGLVVTFLTDCCGAEVEEACADVKPGSIILLENLRFHMEEEGKGLDAAGKKVKAKPENAARFRASLARLADVYVNEAFGTSHRSHSSMLGEGYRDRICGFLVQKELAAFQRAFDNPKRPMLAILGGMKLSDKILVIMHMLDKVDMMIIGGGMAFTVLKAAEGMAIGDSIYDREGAAMVPAIIAKARKNGVELMLPVDFTISSQFGEDGVVTTATREEGIPKSFIGLDCGERSRVLNAEMCARAGTIIWNSALGVVQMPKFEAGTKSLAEAIVKATGRNAITIIGGGNAATCSRKYNAERKVTHCSFANRTFLELLKGKGASLPGIVNLSPKPSLQQPPPPPQQLEPQPQPTHAPPQ